MPVAFDEAAVAHVGMWCREEVGPHIMLDIIVDPDTTGGCAFVYNDTYHDHSLGHAMEAHKGVVTELLNAYAK